MKLSTVKGKLLIGVIVVGLLSSAGFALANSSAGEALKDWYNGVFNQSVDAAKDEVSDYGEDVFADLLAEFEDLLADAGDEIDATRDGETANAEEEITAAKDGHLGSLGEAKAEIVSQMEHQFFNVYMDEWLEIQRLSGEAEASATNELEAFTGEEGDAAIAQLTNDLTAAKEAAVSELEDAIETAKAEISALLDGHSAILVNNLTKEIDYSAEELQETIIALKEELVAEQQNLIAETAAQLTQEAKDSLDDVISGINE